MANKIILKKSSVLGKVPVSSDLEYGELAINYTDGIIYYKDSSNAIKTISGSNAGTAVVDGTLQISASNVTSGVFDPLRLGTGQPSSSTYLRGGNVWSTIEASTIVLTSPRFLMQSKALPNSTVTVKVYATSMLVNGSVASIEITTRKGIEVIIPINNIATTTFTASANLGDFNIVTARAVDSYGNKSSIATYVVTISSVYINKPVITSPENLFDSAENGIAIVTNAFSVVGGTDLHASTDYEVRSSPMGNGTLIWSINSLLGVPPVIPDNTLPAGSTVYIRARHNGTTYGSSQWSDDTQITMVSTLAPSIIGTPFQGGIYVGKIILNNTVQALILSPAYTENALAALGSTGYFLIHAECKSLLNGAVNTADLEKLALPTGLPFTSIYPAAGYCAALTTNGYTDWYLPALFELELIYRNAKPTEVPNNTTLITAPSAALTGYDVFIAPGYSTTDYAYSGQIGSLNTYTDPTGYSYTSNTPTITSAPILQHGTQLEGLTASEYWSSSAPGVPTNSTMQTGNFTYFNMSNGTAFGTTKHYSSAIPAYSTVVRRVRAVRRVFIRNV